MQNKMLYPALVFLSCFLITCNDKGDPEYNTTPPKPATPVVVSSQRSSSKTAAENIITDTSYTILAKALKSTDLMETLNKPGPFTVFTPNNDAFKKLPEGTLDGLIKNRKNDLANILSYHIVAGALKNCDMKDGKKLKTLAGEELIVTMRKNKVLVNGIEVISPEIDASNGIIYMVDGLLFPRSQNPGSY
jgi:uncharacterized surface protein with fasciclin (FAS1) repeats